MIMIFDRKQDFYDLALEFKFLYFLLEDFKDNWIAPPPGVSDKIWFNILAEILATNFELRVASQAMLVDIMCNLSGE
ncbi:MAG: hypothetical protein IIB00_07020 [candidate division Zixibacteria bacterium]|nr:hypothetical protein [candidate division Zixibacteria bacterium]